MSGQTPLCYVWPYGIEARSQIRTKTTQVMSGQTPLCYVWPHGIEARSQIRTKDNTADRHHYATFGLTGSRLGHK